ncbi:GNAT family N-acetyltransferase [Paenibacillus silvae]|uniref:GNAT family N-acetyltransferase n=1 Tax=Paenibacillus silvae TaxID=1325358 RepID=UPI0011A17849|nr:MULTISPECIES: GNAT family N-acetyltransferase [Paenibacillus]MCK6074539.1 GNAT family N-acetyltransferase [Paenibacillus silvae]MCK6147985.1 GNAT family N-acetyltransferase [Paenibacillus silvae]MCK6266283.1 GNAT family N-acetyltransferase [Paenibacillus silvae]
MSIDAGREKYMLRNIERGESDVYWPLRLEALRTHPEAFGASYELSSQLTVSEVKDRIHNEPDDYILGAFTPDGILAGFMGFKREYGPKLRHKGFIWGVYVSPAYRGEGLASRLLSEVLERGRHLEGIKQINLSVVTTNAAARRLYERYGFEVYGIERNALEVNGQGYDEAHMTYFYYQSSDQKQRRK